MFLDDFQKPRSLMSPHASDVLACFGRTPRNDDLMKVFHRMRCCSTPQPSLFLASIYLAGTEGSTVFTISAEVRVKVLAFRTLPVYVALQGTGVDQVKLRKLHENYTIKVDQDFSA